MTYTTGELLDRYTIERRKQIYGAANEKLVAELRSAIKEVVMDGNLVFDAIELALANGTIAVLEWQIRCGHDLSLEEIGRRALEVRNTNAMRVNARARVDGRGNTEFTSALETKAEHLSMRFPEAAE